MTKPCKSAVRQGCSQDKLLAHFVDALSNKPHHPTGSSDGADTKDASDTIMACQRAKSSKASKFKMNSVTPGIYHIV